MPKPFVVHCSLCGKPLDYHQRFDYSEAVCCSLGCAMFFEVRRERSVSGVAEKADEPQIVEAPGESRPRTT